MKEKIINFKLLNREAGEEGFLWQYDYGQKMKLGVEGLPSSYEVHFANNLGGRSVASLGNADGVDIPDEVLLNGAQVFFWLYLHNSEDEGHTVGWNHIDIKKRAKKPAAQATPVQQSFIEQAIAALIAGVSTVEEVAAGIPQAINNALAEAKASGEFDGEKGDPGKDGFSPTATVTKSDNVVTITITDKTGTTTEEVNETDPTAIIDDTAGEGDTAKVWSADKASEELNTVKSALTSMTVEEKLLRDELPGTSKAVTFDANDNPVSIVHSADGQTVRTDVFVWLTNTVTETRTASNKYITITTNLETLAQTISEVQEVA